MISRLAKGVGSRGDGKPQPGEKERTRLATGVTRNGKRNDEREIITGDE